MLVYLENKVLLWVLQRMVMIHKRRRGWNRGQVVCTLVYIRSTIGFESQRGALL